MDSLGAAAIDLAADTVGGSENLLHVALEGLGEGLELHHTGDLDDLIKGHRLGVLDVLLLLAVSRGLLDGLDDQGGGGGNDGDSGLTVLDGELDGDAEALLLVGRKKLGSACYSLPIAHSRFFHTQSPVALAISSPTFLGDRPRGPILGAKADEAPISPPVARRVL